MPTLKVLNKKIKSLKNTRKITRAMKIISATRLRRAQLAAQGSQPYANSLERIIQKITQGEEIWHPLCKARTSVKTIKTLVFTSDRGLCGGFNASVIRKAFNYSEEKKKEGLILMLDCLGKKGFEFFRRRGLKPLAHHEHILKRPTFADADRLGEEIIKQFLAATVDEVYLIYNYFKSVLSQTTLLIKLLPVENPQQEKSAAPGPLLFEPSAAEIFNDLIQRHVKFQIYRAMLNTVAGEHAARMTAMDKATSNSSDLIDKYTLLRNRVRQAAITKELIEIVSGAESLKASA